MSCSARNRPRPSSLFFARCSVPRRSPLRSSSTTRPTRFTVPGCATTAVSPCTLRDAITYVNTHAAVDINFNIAGSGVHTITPASPLPAIISAVAAITIDGYTQPGATAHSNPVGTGSNAVLMIELDLTNAGSGGLVVKGNSVVVRGLVINRSIGVGVTLTGVNDQVIGCFIGTNPAERRRNRRQDRLRWRCRGQCDLGQRHGHPRVGWRPGRGDRQQPDRHQRRGNGHDTELSQGVVFAAQQPRARRVPERRAEPA